MTVWKDISTAPKDGTTVDLWARSFSIGEGGSVGSDEGRRVTGAFWGEPYYGNGHPRNGPPEAWVKYDSGQWEEIELGGTRATHWTPLPPPPDNTDAKYRSWARRVADGLLSRAGAMLHGLRRNGEHPSRGDV